MSEADSTITRMIGERITAQTFEQIMDHYYSNIFVADGAGNILYTNKKTAASLECPQEQIMNMTVRQLQEQGYTSRSMTEEAIQKRAQAVGSYYNRRGEEIATVSTPVFDADGTLCMVVTYSEEMSTLDAFMEDLKKGQAKYENMKRALGYIEEQEQRSIIVQDYEMQRIFSMLKEIAKSDSTVMLYGESGVGKDVAATFIQSNSRRNQEVMIPVNCAAIPKELVEAELFGYERGAFTGASHRGKSGLFELANEGTLFLDEIGELPLQAQTKLLRVLETGDFRRVGGTRQLHTDVRIIGATNRDLKELVERKEFREDLYYRLNVVPITIPPLRERPKDVEGLVHKFLTECNRKYAAERVISEAFWARIRQYSWPGNVRELRNTIERFVLTGTEFIPNLKEQSGRENPFEGQQWFEQEACSAPLHEVLDDVERRYIKSALVTCGENVAATAKMLGIHQSVLYKKMKKAGITRRLV